MRRGTSRVQLCRESSGRNAAQLPPLLRPLRPRFQPAPSPGPLPGITPCLPEDRLSAFDPHRAQLLTASGSIRSWPLLKRAGQEVYTGHDQPVIAALYNPNFHQVVTGDEAAQVLSLTPSPIPQFLETPKHPFIPRLK